MINEERIKRILVNLAEVVNAECEGSAEHVSEHFDVTELINIAKELKGNVEIDYDNLSEYRN